MPWLLTDFRCLRPSHRIAQRESFEWLIRAHVQAEQTRSRSEGGELDVTRFSEQLRRVLTRVGCGEDRLAQRFSALADVTHGRWSEMRIYRLDRAPAGADTLERTRIFTELAAHALRELYLERAAPAELVHVTCTGYESPSAAQRLVAERGWGDRTRVQHAYHMGCYAAFPAVRLAAGLLATGEAGVGRRADVAHTEICSLHVNPLDHAPEQLVVQTLFADGFIVYSVCAEADWERRGPALALLAQDERLVPGTAEQMGWISGAHGMRMNLSREVPRHLAGVVVPFVERLFERAGLPPEQRRSAWYALHPGGPRILDELAEALELRPAQLATSRDVLREHGNMSSATLPHIWERLLAAPEVTSAQPIVSLAFGPGLTVCGAVLRKQLP